MTERASTRLEVRSTRGGGEWKGKVSNVPERGNGNMLDVRSTKYEGGGEWKGKVSNVPERGKWEYVRCTKYDVRCMTERASTRLEVRSTRGCGEWKGRVSNVPERREWKYVRCTKYDVRCMTERDLQVYSVRTERRLCRVIYDTITKTV
jgi:hypothetical protein